MSLVPVKVTSRNRDGREVFEAVVSLPGLRPTKVVRKSDGTTYFGTKAAVLTSARNVVKKMGFVGVEELKPVSKRAAKRATQTQAQESQS